MKKVLLVTIQNLHNHGNRLQNYALQTVMERMGIEVHNLSVVQMRTGRMDRLRALAKMTLYHLGVKKFAEGASSVTKRVRMDGFTRKHIHRYLFMRREDVDQCDFSGYDAVVTGSDQVWHNWHRMERELPYYYLEFVPEEKRVSYAPSFGFTAFPEEDVENHRRGLMGMKKLSCREQEGCDMIRELTSRTATKVLDPTLLLSPSDWQAVEKKPHFRVPRAYVLQCMLGRSDPESEYARRIRRIASARKIPIIDINKSSLPDYYSISPAEFIWLIHHADIICTDSFHASVFSVIFGKDLQVFKRDTPNMEHMFGRIQDLLCPLGLEGCIYGREGEQSARLDSMARERLKCSQEQSLQYLRDCMERGETIKAR